MKAIPKQYEYDVICIESAEQIEKFLDNVKVTENENEIVINANNNYNFLVHYGEMIIKTNNGFTIFTNKTQFYFLFSTEGE